MLPEPAIMRVSSRAEARRWPQASARRGPFGGWRCGASPGKSRATGLAGPRTTGPRARLAASLAFATCRVRSRIAATACASSGGGVTSWRASVLDAVEDDQRRLPADVPNARAPDLGAVELVLGLQCVILHPGPGLARPASRAAGRIGATCFTSRRPLGCISSRRSARCGRGQLPRRELAARRMGRGRLKLAGAGATDQHQARAGLQQLGCGSGAPRRFRSTSRPPEARRWPQPHGRRSIGGRDRTKRRRLAPAAAGLNGWTGRRRTVALRPPPCGRVLRRWAASAPRSVALPYVTVCSSAAARASLAVTHA